MSNTHEQMEFIAELLESAEKYNLQIEVIYTFGKICQEFPKMDLTQAWLLAYNEWVK